MVINLAGDNQPPTETQNPSGEMLNGSYKMSFADVLRMGYAKADNIVIGDADHDDYQKIWGTLGQTDTLIAVAESGVSDMFLELPHYRQGLINEFQSSVMAGGNGDVAGFSHRFEHEDDVINNRSRWSFNEAEETQSFLQGSVAPLLAHAARFNIDAHAIDYEKGRAELQLLNEARRTLVAIRDETERIKATEDISDPTIAARLTQLRQQFQQGTDVYTEARRDYFNARSDDQDLAQTINSTANGQKTLTMLGFVHGSRMNDFEEYLQGHSLKIDIAVNRESYERQYTQEMDKLRASNPDFGTDLPDLVYFIDEGVISTTAATSPELLSQLSGLSPTVEQQQDTPTDSIPDQDRKFGEEGYTPNIKWN